MKKILLTLAVLLILPAALSAEAQFRLLGITNSAIDDDPHQKNKTPPLSRDVSVDAGLETEIIIDHLGLGFDGLVNFKDNAELQAVSWQGQIFMSYHVFKAGSFFDPYLQCGFGNAGVVDVLNGVHRGDDKYLTGLNLSLFPSLSAGISLDFKGLLLGCRYSYLPYNWKVPGAPINPATLSEHQFALYAGIALGDHQEEKKCSDSLFKLPHIKVDIWDDEED